MDAPSELASAISGSTRQQKRHNPQIAPDLPSRSRELNPFQTAIYASIPLRQAGCWQGQKLVHSPPALGTEPNCFQSGRQVILKSGILVPG
jgi:hypothetical protein